VPPLSDILGQIDKRLREKYAFTIFAANEKEHSVNSGIVLNYRQKWTPLAYQAGKLINQPNSKDEHWQPSRSLAINEYSHHCFRQAAN